MPAELNRRWKKGFKHIIQTTLEELQNQKISLSMFKKDSKLDSSAIKKPVFKRSPNKKG